MIDQNTVEKIIYMSWRRERKGIGLLLAHNNNNNNNDNNNNNNNNNNNDNKDNNNQNTFRFTHMIPTRHPPHIHDLLHTLPHALSCHKMKICKIFQSVCSYELNAAINRHL